MLAWYKDIQGDEAVGTWRVNLATAMMTDNPSAMLYISSPSVCPNPPTHPASGWLMINEDTTHSPKPNFVQKNGLLCRAVTPTIKSAADATRREPDDENATQMSNDDDEMSPDDDMSGDTRRGSDPSAASNATHLTAVKLEEDGQRSFSTQVPTTEERGWFMDLDQAIHQAYADGAPVWVTDGRGGNEPRKTRHLFASHNLKHGARIDFYRGLTKDDLRNKIWVTWLPYLPVYHMRVTASHGCDSVETAGNAMEIVAGLAYAASCDGTNLYLGQSIEWASEESRTMWARAWEYCALLGLKVSEAGRVSGPPAIEYPALVLCPHITYGDDASWTSCPGECGFWNDGLMGHNYCCDTCAQKPGTHSKGCRRTLGRISPGDDIAPTAASLCEHAQDPATCKVCEGSVVPGTACPGLSHFMPCIGVDNVAQPIMLHEAPDAIGYTIADSSMRMMVDDPQPRCYHCAARYIWVFSIPGCAILPNATDYTCSTWHMAWQIIGGLSTRSRIYVVPCNDSINGPWGNGDRATAQEKIYDAVRELIRTLPTVHEVVAELNLHMNDVFLTDHMHMTRAATKKIHACYWRHIDRIQHLDGEETTHVPIMVWDFNASTRHMNDEILQHKSFWKTVTAWGLATPSSTDVCPESGEREKQRVYLNRLLIRKEPQQSWYKASRLKTIRYKNPAGKDPVTGSGWLHSDESKLDASDESDEQWWPGRESSQCKLHKGLIVSHSAVEALAAKEGWPENSSAIHWKAALMSVGHHCHHSRPIAIRTMVTNAARNYRMLFACYIQYYASIDPAQHLCRGREASTGITRALAEAAVSTPVQDDDD